MLATRAPNGFGPARIDDGWELERKLDGLRCIAVRVGSDVSLWSRNGLSWTTRFATVTAAIAALPVDDVVLDGEIVARDDRGRDSFGALQSGGDAPVLAVFDLLHLLGHDTVDLPLPERRHMLRLALDGVDPAVEVVEPLVGETASLLQQACHDGWEGLMAKRAAAPYRSGRSPHWLKMPCVASQELVVGGWSDPRGTRPGLGALLVGYYEGGHLHYAGRVGAGFTQMMLADVHARLTALATPHSPFAELITDRDVHWVRPELVAAVGFREWTAGGRLRQPRYLGLRDDKAAADVRRER